MKLKLICILNLFILLLSCNKDNTTDPSVEIPVITTTTVNNITSNTAASGGTISNDGGSTITARGVCWSAGNTPIISDNKTSDGTGVGSFTSNITGLTAKSTYYVRAYATNSSGTGYGNAVSFTTSMALPVLTTNSVINITTTTATSGGNISSDGGSTITARGVCWSTVNTPTINDYKTIDGTGIGNFTSNITGLIPSTTYYVRAYATNGAGTNYGSVEQFKTLGEIVTDIDGNVYHTIRIGTQVWMVENLKTTKYSNGEAIPNVIDTNSWYKLKTGAYSNYDNSSWYDPTNYGRLYNWYAVNDSRKIAPSGWHVASDPEWTTLTTYLSGGVGAGGKLKETGTANWQDPNTGATNELGYTALPGGYRGDKGAFFEIGYYGFWWSSTENLDPFVIGKSWGRYMGYNIGVVEMSYFDKYYGFSIRCVKDE